MSNLFGEYAEFYDLLYHDKVYVEEAAFVSRLLHRHLGKPAAQIELLDLACGTGRHAQEWARMGYRVEGSDLSTEMVLVARERAKAQALPILFHNESFQSCDRIGRKYDAVLAMFSAIDYVTEYPELSRTLANIRGLLKRDGLFIFDFWNGNAVMRDYSPVRTKRVERGDQILLRVSNTSLDAVAQTATVKFDFKLSKGGVALREFSERHVIRYFFPQEMTDLLAANGFKVIYRCPFLKEDSALMADEWNVTYVTRPCE
jgi:predicted TPR repeat methyltransferase